MVEVDYGIFIALINIIFPFFVEDTDLSIID